MASAGPMRWGSPPAAPRSSRRCPWPRSLDSWYGAPQHQSVQEQPTQVGEGMVLGGLVAEERGEPLVQLGQLAGRGAYLFRCHEDVLLDGGEKDLIRTGPPDFDVNPYCKLRLFWVDQNTRCRSR